MKMLSIRMRLTILLSLLIILIAVTLTISSMLNARGALVTHYSTAQESGMPNGLEQHTSQGGTSAIIEYRNDENAENAQEKKSFNIVKDDTGEFGLTTMSNAIHQFNSASLIYMAAIILLGSILTYCVLGFALRPMRRLSEEIANISENQLSKRISENEAGDEINRLAGSFNTLLERLEKVFTGQKGFASAAAHELKTPISVIKTNLDVLALETAPSIEDYRHMVAITQSQVQRMSQLVDDLFAISMQQECECNDRVDLNLMLSEILQDLTQDIKAKKLRVTTLSDATLTANATMLRRALSNIIENAVKYNKDGGDIKITYIETAKQREIIVADTGIGIDETHLSHVFDPFYRVDASRSRKVAGAGLGLAIAKDMVVRQGGTLYAASNPEGEGMVFTLALQKDPLLSSIR